MEGADPPQEDHQEDPDTEVEVLDQETPQTGQPGTPAQSPLQRRMERRRAEQQGAPQEQPQEERATTIYAIEEGQAWQLVVGQAGTKSEPAGGTNEYGAEHVNPILAQKAHQLKMKYPHPGMRPCSTCYGILGEGICRRDAKCELARARKRDKCLNCGERAEVCRSTESSCEEPLEAAVCVAATLYERIGHERYIRACPTEDMIDVTTKGRDSMWKGLKPHTVREAEQMTEWDLYHVVHMDTATGRSLVRGTGGTWTMSTRNVPAWIASEYERRSAEGEKTRRPQRRTVALADIIEELSDEESSADEDMEPPCVTYSDRGITYERTPSRKQIKAEEERYNTDRKIRERALKEREAAERTRLANMVARNATDEGTMATAMMQMAQTLKTMQDKMLHGKERDSHTDSEDDEEEALLNPASYRSGSDIMSQLLDALERDKEDLDMRPKLYFCLEAQGYHSRFPFRKMQGDPRHMDISCMLDENAATPADKTQEQRQLQAIQGHDESSLEAGKNGSVRMVAGKKPQLSKPSLQKKITTKDDLFLALYAWAHHYGAAGLTQYQEQVVQHTLSLREIWQSRVLGDDAKALIDLDARLRDFRCREGRNACWTVSNDTNSADQRILAKIITESRARNSNRRDKDPSDAEGKGGKKKGKGGKGATELPKPRAGTTVEVPKDFFNECSDQAPDVCAMFAWAGKCSKSSGDSCQSNRGHTYIHTCKVCRFEKGEHPIIRGACPK